MNIIIPIAGPDNGNSDTEYIKSLQEIERKTVIQYVFETLGSIRDADVIVVVKRSDAVRYHLDDIIRLLAPGANIVMAEGETMGAACTCLLTIDQLKLDEPLLILGINQILLENLQDIIDDFRKRDLDGGVAVFRDIHPRWSYVRLDENDNVIEAAEKRPISQNAVAGMYYFKTASLFVESAKKMILKNASVNGKFYVCPVYNEMVLAQKRIGVYRVDKSKYYNFSYDSGMDAFRAYLSSERGDKQ